MDTWSCAKISSLRAMISASRRSSAVAGSGAGMPFGRLREALRCSRYACKTYLGHSGPLLRSINPASNAGLGCGVLLTGLREARRCSRYTCTYRQEHESLSLYGSMA